MGIVFFIVWLLWQLGDKAENHYKHYQKFETQRFFAENRITVIKEVGTGFFLGVLVEFLFSL